MHIDDIKYSTRWDWDYENQKPQLILTIWFEDMNAEEYELDSFVFNEPERSQYTLLYDENTEEFIPFLLHMGGTFYKKTATNDLPYPELREELWKKVRLSFVTEHALPDMPLFCSDCGLKQAMGTQVPYQQEMVHGNPAGNPCYYCREHVDPTSLEKQICRKWNVSNVMELPDDVFNSFLTFLNQARNALTGRNKHKKKPQ